MKKIIPLLIAAILVAAGIYYFLSPALHTKEKNEMISSELPPLAQGVLIADAHEVAGTVRIIDQNGTRFLQFENLDTINGPDLYIYLSTDTTAEDFVNLGKIQATRGNVTYEIPAGTDIQRYDTALIWCRAFRVLFSHAELS